MSPETAAPIEAASTALGVTKTCKELSVLKINY